MKAKIAASDVAMVLEQAHGLVSCIPALVAENRAMKEKIATWERTERAGHLVRKMDERGFAASLEGGTDDEKIASLLGSGRDLRVLEEAVDLVPTGGSPFEVSSNRPSGGQGSRTDLEKFVLGEID